MCSETKTTPNSQKNKFGGTGRECLRRRCLQQTSIALWGAPTSTCGGRGETSPRLAIGFAAGCSLVLFAGRRMNWHR